ncbi:hypothetical protein [Mycobacteroides abscessus]|uniref:hypothetical protein n=1 Tax=Mycobacteroides abscessus TaxID=36809 RepID=UPI000C25C67F|nr:hypothetical protein [Mycobacteroides abscessus]
MSHNDNLAYPITVIDNTIGDIYVKLSGSTVHRWQLFWHDGIANEFTETYDELPVALARLATLMYCGQFDFDRYFTTNAAEFPPAARTFLESVTQ